MHSDEKAVGCVQFLREAGAHHASLGVCIERVATDNGTRYKKIFCATWAELGVRHVKIHRAYVGQQSRRKNTAFPSCCGGINASELPRKNRSALLGSVLMKPALGRTPSELLKNLGEVALSRKSAALSNFCERQAIAFD